MKMLQDVMSTQLCLGGLKGIFFPVLTRDAVISMCPCLKECTKHKVWTIVLNCKKHNFEDPYMKGLLLQNEESVV